MDKLLIANRGEIAIRIARAAADYGVRSVAVYSSDDAESLHVAKADEAVALHGTGVAAYLDIAHILAAAAQAGADAIHPGYGFLSENAEFARACADAGITFVGPSATVLDQFGDKLQARCLARDNDVPVAAGSYTAATIEEAEELLSELDGGIMIKAVAGGGGRGMRPVHSARELAEAWARCCSEARGAFGNDEVYVEQLLPAARHIEVQIIGDGSEVIALGERECSLQRRHQKLLEIAPAPGIPASCREQLYAYACQLGRAVAYRGVGTVEFMVWNDWQEIAFIEVNPRLQVEHTVTEETTGLDLVQLQLRIADGESLVELGLASTPVAVGFAVQSRINMETMQADGSTLPAGGTLSVFEPPNGPRVRVDHFGYSGYTTSVRYDSLIAKVITHFPGNDFAAALQANYRALCEFRIEGVDSNLGFMQNLLQHRRVRDNDYDTAFIDAHLEDLIEADQHPQHFIAGTAAAAPQAMAAESGPEGSNSIEAQMQGTIVSVSVAEGDTIVRGQELLVMESMKLEHVIAAPAGGSVAQVMVEEGDTVFTGHALLHLFASGARDDGAVVEEAIDVDLVRPDLQNVIDLHAFTLDENRVEKLVKLRARGKQTARENIAQLTEGGDFIEYGALVVAAQRGRLSEEELRINTPADGLVTGVGQVNRELFDDTASRTAILAYDYSVIAGTQGHFNHTKTDRMVAVVEKCPMPLVFFAEGGGGRPGDVDTLHVANSGLPCISFGNLASLSGRVPMVGINAGYCFAGNAAFLALNDIIIATRDSWLGMGGPAMIEGGGLGTFDKEEIGPIEVQIANGSVDVVVDNEQQAVAATKQYLSYFQGSVDHWQAADQRTLRHLVPENRNRSYDIHKVIDTLADTGSVLELRPDFTPGYITCLARIEGRPIAILANNNQVLSGAIDAAGARKADRFMKLCEKFGMRILFLVDCPGFIVGPEYDKEGTARAGGDMYITGASLTVPKGAIIIRKAYGLGAMAAMAGSSRAGSFTISWPSGEAGGMGLEGSIRLGYKKELEAIDDLTDRDAKFRSMVAQAYERAKTTNAASMAEIDAVVDPRDSRRWINRLL